MYRTSDRIVGSRDVGLVAMLAVFVLNAAVTIVHFGGMFSGHITTRNPLDMVLRIAIPDIAIAAVPSFIAAYGLWKARRWGLWIALIVAGAYFHGQIELLIMAFQQRRRTPKAPGGPPTAHPQRHPLLQSLRPS